MYLPSGDSNPRSAAPPDLTGPSPSSRLPVPSDRIDPLAKYDQQAVINLPLEEQGNDRNFAFSVENRGGQGFHEARERRFDEPYSRSRATEDLRQMQKMPEQRTATQRAKQPHTDHIQAINGNVISRALRDNEMSDNVRDLSPSNANRDKEGKSSFSLRRNSGDESNVDKKLATGLTVKGSQSLIVDEFGRLAQKGASESESEGYRRSFKWSRSRSRGSSSSDSSSSIRRRSRDKGRRQGRGRARHWSRNRNTSRGRGRGRSRDRDRGKSQSRSRSSSGNNRSRSRSRSHEPRPRRQSISHSPQRIKTSSRSYSRSPQRRRNFSRSPPKGVRERGTENFKRDRKVDHDWNGRGRNEERRGRPIPCIHFARGRCSRGDACRFLHANRQTQGHDASTEDNYFEKHGWRKEADRQEYTEERHNRSDWGREAQTERFGSKNSDFAEKQLDSLNPRRLLHKSEGDKSSSSSATIGMRLNKISTKEPMSGSNQHAAMVEEKSANYIIQNVSTTRESPNLPSKFDLHEVPGVLRAGKTEEIENSKKVQISQIQGVRLEMETTGNVDSRVNAVEKNILPTDFVTSDIYADLRGKLQEHILKISFPNSNGAPLAPKLGGQVELQATLNTKNEGNENSHVRIGLDQSQIRNESEQSGHQLLIPTSRIEVAATSAESGLSVLPPVHVSNPPQGQYCSSIQSQHPVPVGSFPHPTLSNNPYRLYAHNATLNTQPLGQSSVSVQSHENSHVQASLSQQPSPTVNAAFYGQSFPGTHYSQTVNSGAAQYLKPPNVLNAASVFQSDSEATSSQNAKAGAPNFGLNSQPSVASPPVMHNSALLGQPGHSNVAQNTGTNLPFQQAQLTPGGQAFNSSVSLQLQHSIMNAKALNITSTSEFQPSATTQNTASWLFHSPYNQAVPQLLPTGPSTSYSYALTKVPPLSGLVKAPETNSLPDQYDPLSDVLETQLNATTSVFTDSLSGMKPTVLTVDTQVSVSENMSGVTKTTQQSKVNASEADAANDTTADACTVDDHSLENWSPGLPEQRIEAQSDEQLQPLSKKGSRGLKMLRAAVAEHVKEVLKPTWREGYMSKEAFKTIAKKAVDKVIGNVPNHHIPKTPEKVDQFMKSSRPKISKLVQGYVDKYLKL